MTDAMKTSRLYLLRHGPTTAPKGCFVGSTDVPLSGRGLSRLQGAVTPLQAVDCWYCSPMLRTRQTLKYLRQHGCPVHNPVYDERLREIDFGRWEMQTFAEIASADPQGIEAWNRYPDFTFPTGEAVPAFIRRAEEMLAVFSTANSGSICAVTHGGIIRTMICLALGLSVRNYLLFAVEPASLTVLELFTEGWILRGLNVLSSVVS